MLCGGNVSEYCGGPNRLDMYQLDGSLPVPTSTTSIPGTSPTPTPGAPSVVASVGGYSYIGCYTDSTANRALTGLINPVAGATLTVELCAAACAGFTYFGVEYSGMHFFGFNPSLSTPVLERRYCLGSKRQTFCPSTSQARLDLRGASSKRNADSKIV